MSHEEALIRAFVRPDKRRRYPGKLVKDRRWIDEVVGFDYGTMISCIEGRLGYLESEDGRYFLERS